MPSSLDVGFEANIWAGNRPCGFATWPAFISRGGWLWRLHPQLRDAYWIL